MNSPKQILIVGGGLAGAFMAAESVKAGHEVVMVDEELPNSASQVAAGLFNVVTGRVASKTWMADQFITALNSFFSTDLLAPLSRFLHPSLLYRPYKSISERNEWFLRAVEKEFEGWVIHQSSPRDENLISNPLGGLEILGCGWLEVGKFTTALKGQLVMSGKMELVLEKFDHQKMNAANMTVQLQGKARAFDEVIFAEGIGVLNNSLFDWVGIVPMKGQVLEIEMPDLPRDYVLMRKAYLVPRGTDRFVVGSTYENNFTDLNPTKEGVDALKEYIKAATPLPFRVVEARAGARPTTPNRRPVMGRHPEFPQVCIFNGLGAKGVLQGPWCARMFRQWLDGTSNEIPKEAMVNRFR